MSFAKLILFFFCAGSVNGGNSKELAGQPDLDGFLVGGASLKVNHDSSFYWLLFSDHPNDARLS